MSIFFMPIVHQHDIAAVIGDHRLAGLIGAGEIALVAYVVGRNDFDRDGRIPPLGATRPLGNNPPWQLPRLLS
jgi:hypothetical protein